MCSKSGLQVTVSRWPQSTWAQVLTLGLNHGSGWGLGSARAPGFFPYLLSSWIHSCLRKADKNKDNKMSFKELQNFLKELNIQVDDSYARKIFRVRQRAGGGCPPQGP